MYLDTRTVSLALSGVWLPADCEKACLCMCEGFSPTNLVFICQYWKGWMKFGPQGSSYLILAGALWSVWRRSSGGTECALRDAHEVERTQQGFIKLPAIHPDYRDRIRTGSLVGVLLPIQIFSNSCPVRCTYQLSAASALEYNYVFCLFSRSVKDIWWWNGATGRRTRLVGLLVLVDGYFFFQQYLVFVNTWL